ncbi:RICIN domain-containing protein [Crossiella cryophila]|uniref:Ricin B lectin domain-containing protein n=1 Tax=Crossiella cryophila TaxID=43355 RepID=A0A7W7CEW7_9PSEU|nr:RICIN domain-containing protein [Crossiella cryophila]MBB4679727.1 hypothetical protein [Crossiella cryophila]
MSGKRFPLRKILLGALVPAAVLAMSTPASAAEATWRFQSAASGLCMEIGNASPAPGAPVQQFHCSSRATRINYVDAGGVRYRAMLKPVVSGLCVTVDDASIADGALLSQQPCTGAANQLFDVVPSEPPVGARRIRAAHSGKCVGVPPGATGTGVRLIQTTCANLWDQWQLMRP